jgi:hypothetical protein
MPSIVVIGNGPSVLKNKLGHLVDSFDEVVRINHYVPIKEYLGEKLTIFVLHWGVTQVYKEVPKLAKTIYLRKDVSIDRVRHMEYPQTVVLDQSLTRDLLLTHGFKVSPVKPCASTGVAFLAHLVVENKYDKISY